MTGFQAIGCRQSLVAYRKDFASSGMRLKRASHRPFRSLENALERRRHQIDYLHTQRFVPFCVRFAACAVLFGIALLAPKAGIYLLGLVTAAVCLAALRRVRQRRIQCQEERQAIRRLMNILETCTVGLQTIDALRRLLDQPGKSDLLRKVEILLKPLTDSLNQLPGYFQRLNQLPFRSEAAGRAALSLDPILRVLSRYQHALQALLDARRPNPDLWDASLAILKRHAERVQDDFLEDPLAQDCLCELEVALQNET